MLLNKYFNKLPLYGSTNRQEIILNSQWEEETVKLNIIVLDEENNAFNEWTGELTKSEILESACELELEFDVFLNECKEALTTNGGKENYEYIFDGHLGTFSLTKKSSFKMTFLRFDLIPITDQKRFLFLHDVLEIIGNLKSCAKDNHLAILRCEEAYGETLEAFQRCVEEAKLQETQLIEKCALLLNEKKAKIAKLEKMLPTVTKAIEANDVDESVSAPEDDFAACTQEISTAPTIKKRRKFNLEDNFKFRPSTSSAAIGKPSSPDHANHSENRLEHSTPNSEELFSKM